MTVPKEPSEEADGIAYAVIGAAIEVGLRGLPVARQAGVSVAYKGRPVGEGRLDLFVSELVIVELKAVRTFTPLHKAQLISYLKAAKVELGLLINFNVPILKDGIERVVQT